MVHCLAVGLVSSLSVQFLAHFRRNLPQFPLDSDQIIISFDESRRILVATANFHVLFSSKFGHFLRDYSTPHSPPNLFQTRLSLFADLGRVRAGWAAVRLFGLRSHSSEVNTHHLSQFISIPAVFQIGYR